MGKSLGQCIWRINRTGNVLHLEPSLLTPVLQSKVLGFDMSATRCRSILVDDIDGCHVVDVHHGGTILKHAEFFEDMAKV